MGLFSFLKGLRLFERFRLKEEQTVFRGRVLLNAGETEDDGDDDVPGNMELTYTGLLRAL